MRLLDFFRKPPKIERLVGYTTSDLYLAAYLMTEGASIETVVLRTRKVNKDYFEKRFSIRLNDVKASAIERWKKKQAVGNLVDFSKARLKIKKECSIKLQKSR